MKKTIILLLIFATTLLLVNTVYAASTPGIEFPDDAGTSYLYDWTVNEDNDSIKAFQSYTHPHFGAVSTRGTYTDYLNRPIFDSWWNSNQPTVYEQLTHYEYRLYRFSKYVDIPINIIQTRSVVPGATDVFTMEHIATTSQTSATTVTTGNQHYWEYSNNFGFNFGLSVPLSNIQLDGTMHSENRIKIGGNYWQEKIVTQSSTTTFEARYSETFSLYNNTDNYHYFQLNYRQKYRIYFVAIYEHQYSVSEWGSGLFGLDKNWSYTHDGFNGVETKFYLIPVDNTYFEISRYYDNAQGRKVIYNKTHPSIYYI